MCTLDMCVPEEVLFDPSGEHGRIELKSFAALLECYHCRTQFEVYLKVAATRSSLKQTKFI